METSEQLRAHIRWCIRRDMPEVLAIENLCHQFPWVEEDFLAVLRQRNCIAMVAETVADVGQESVVGYMVYNLHKTKLHVINFAVDPKFRRQGIGSQLVARLSSKLASHRRTRITLEVRESNLEAQLFFRSQGFRAVNVKRGFYADSGEDAYLMSLRIDGEQPPF